MKLTKKQVEMATSIDPGAKKHLIKCFKCRNGHYCSKAYRDAAELVSAETYDRSHVDHVLPGFVYTQEIQGCGEIVIEIYENKITYRR